MNKIHTKFDLTDKKFNRLKVIRFHSIIKGKRCWICQCDCGKEVIIGAKELKSGATKSCGCYNIEQISQRFTTHGKRNTSEYNSWQNMLMRCLNKNNSVFDRYGGRGIKICDRWIKSFESFFEDMGKKPTSNHSLDRYPNNDGDYEPSNCRWATSKEQNNNKRNVIHEEIEGIIMNRSETIEYLDIPKTTFYRYINKGCTLEQIKSK